MKAPLFLSAFAAFILLSSFKGHKHPTTSVSAAGVYGVSSDPLPFVFELSLNADKTFHYVNNSVPGKAIDVSGTWEQNGNKIKLSNYTSAFPIHDKWHVDSYGCLKSRRGLEFTRLCNIGTAVK